MKKVIGFLFGLGFLFCVSFAFAGSYTVTATWEMTPAPTDLAGFNLRINGDNATIINLPSEARSWTGIVGLADGENVIDLQAIDEGGQVSEWSDPASFDPVPNRPVLTIIILKY